MMYLVSRNARNNPNYYAFVRWRNFTILRVATDDLAFSLDPTIEDHYPDEMRMYFCATPGWAFTTPYGDHVYISRENGIYKVILNDLGAYSFDEQHPDRVARFVQWIQTTKAVLVCETNEYRAVDLLRLLKDRRNVIELLDDEGYVLLAAFRGAPHELMEWERRGVALVQSCIVRGKKVEVLTGTVDCPVRVDGEPVSRFSDLRALLRSE